MEIPSPSNDPDALRAQCRTYLALGAEEAWIVDPVTETVEIYTPDGQSQTSRLGFDFAPLRARLRQVFHPRRPFAVASASASASEQQPRPVRCDVVTKMSGSRYLASVPGPSRPTVRSPIRRARRPRQTRALPRRAIVLQDGDRSRAPVLTRLTCPPGTGKQITAKPKRAPREGARNTERPVTFHPFNGQI